MDQENQPSVDINLADAETLTQLQGVGERLAEHIIEARPFGSIDDLTRVQGISERDVERLRPFLSLSEAEVEVEVEETAEAETELGEELEATFDETADETIAAITEIEAEAEETIDEVEGVEELSDSENADEEETPEEITTMEADAEDETVPEELEVVEESPAAPAPQPAYVTRGGACGLIFLGGLATLILAIIITLGILSSFNNGRLTYASPYQIAALSAEVESLSTQAETLSEDIEGLRTRMDNLEALSGQMSEMQAEFGALQEEITDLQAIVVSNQEEYALLVAQIDVINEDINELTNQNERFEGFLEGLRTLMESLFPETTEVEETP
jgi:competence protein ComEA